MFRSLVAIAITAVSWASFSLADEVRLTPTGWGLSAGTAGTFVDT